jgi:hypothetical protein
LFEVSNATAEAKAEAESEAKAEDDVEPDDVSFPGNKLLVELGLGTLDGLLKDKIGCFERTLFFGLILLGLKSSTLSSLIGSKIS